MNFEVKESKFAFIVNKNVLKKEKYPSQIYRFSNKLFEFGGNKICINKELINILNGFIKYGKIMDYPAKMKRMKQSRCHDNAEKLNQSNPDYKIFTGFALSDDLMWRYHSWCLYKEKIVETTVKRILYYGIYLDLIPDYKQN